LVANDRHARRATNPKHIENYLPMSATKTLLAILGCLLTSGFSFAQHAGPLVMAHRGGSHEFEENTMDAFRHCYEQGIRGFETDVRMTKDGSLVILHDDSLDRTYHSSGAVEDKLAAELKDLVSKRGQKFLFLEELLDYLADKPGFYLELEMKTSNKKLYPDERIGEYCRALHAAAEAKRPQKSIYAYTSFDDRPLKEIRRIDADAPTLLIEGNPLSPKLIERAKSLDVDYIGCQLSGTSRTMVKEAQKQGFKVNCWPGHTIEDYFLCRGLGVNVHCTDKPLAVLKVKEKLQD
jgi:glycerophosphoryl diester phosphodiesterase